jgi:hypothetical protein
MVLESNGYCVGELRLCCSRVIVRVLECNGCDVREGFLQAAEHIYGCL